MMKNKKIIISGPPGSGKTTIINTLREKGYLVHSEVNPQEINKKVSKLELSNYIFKKRIEQYQNPLIKTTQFDIKTKKKDTLIFFDRSMIDVIAYMNFWKETYPEKWDHTISTYRYEKNIFYVPKWEEIYKRTEERPEHYIEAEKIDLFLRKAFLKYNYNIIELPKLNVDERVNFILDQI